MAELNESKMNFAALKRVDPYAKSLLETAAHVALYNFVNNEWDKTDIEGALFVYSRSGEPYHNILIMNRLNMKNLVEPITQGLDLQLQDPFLLYRTSQGSIYGIWFYDKEECVKIASTLTKIIKEGSEGKPDKKERMSMEPMGKNVDIFSMLTKAQEEFNSKSPQKNRPDMFGVPLDMNSNLKEAGRTPQSVMDFFAKAINGPNFMQDPNVIQQPGMFMSSPRSGPPPGLARMQSVPIAIPPPQTDVKPFLQRLMSNPAHSVEHIEKQQRAITPKNEFGGVINNGNPVLTSNCSETMNNLNFNMGLGVLPNNKPGVDSTVSQIHGENSVGFLSIPDSPPVTVHSQQFFNSKLVQNCSPLLHDSTLESLVITSSCSENHRPLSAPMETHLKPALMPPVMFTSSVKKEDYIEATPTTTTAAILNTSGKNSYPAQPEPLTKNQLLQAVNYLLKHDADFINKLHEAYVKSFSELVS